MNLRSSAVPAGVFLLAFSHLVSAQDKRQVTFEDILSLKTVGAPRISPDGQSVVYTVTAWEAAGEDGDEDGQDNQGNQGNQGNQDKR